MMNDILKDTPIYQHMTKDAREEGREEGREEMSQKALEKFRQTVIVLVSQRFPNLVRLARKQTMFIEDMEALQQLVIKMSVAQTETEARQYLLEADEDENNIE